MLRTLRGGVMAWPPDGAVAPGGPARPPDRPARAVVAGGTGFLGQPLVRSLVESGHEVIVLSRGGEPAPGPALAWRGVAGARTLRWTADERLESWGHLLDGADAVVNLAGASIAARRWTGDRKRELRTSRVQPTRALAAAIDAAGRRPGVLVQGSAVGYYGSRGDTRLVEASSPGDDFLGRLSVEWEEAARPAAGAGTRVVWLRTGIVLERDGGALPQMMLPFRLFAGGPIGTGHQYLPWIHRADWIALVRWLLTTLESGPFNGTAPEPVTNAEFSRLLGAAMGRPARVRAPAFALRAFMGEMADAILGGQRATPQRALALGFQFTYPTLDLALAAILDRSRSS